MGNPHLVDNPEIFSGRTVDSHAAITSSLCPVRRSCPLAPNSFCSTSPKDGRGRWLGCSLRKCCGTLARMRLGAHMRFHQGRAPRIERLQIARHRRMDSPQFLFGSMSSMICLESSSGETFSGQGCSGPLFALLWVLL